MLQSKMTDCYNELRQILEPMIFTKKAGLVFIKNKFVATATTTTVALSILSISKIYNYMTEDKSKHIKLTDVVKYTAATVTVLTGMAIAAYILLNKMPIPGQFDDLD